MCVCVVEPRTISPQVTQAPHLLPVGRHHHAHLVVGEIERGGEREEREKKEQRQRRDRERERGREREWGDVVLNDLCK